MINNVKDDLSIKDHLKLQDLETDPVSKLALWLSYDLEEAVSPSQLSTFWNLRFEEPTFTDFGRDQFFVKDSRGFGDVILEDMINQIGISNIHLNKRVQKVTYSTEGVEIDGI